MKITYTKNRFIIIFLSLITVGCTGSENNNGSGQSPTPLTCADDFQVCSPPHLTALYGGDVFYFNEATEINQTVKISEGEKQTFYAIIHDSDISSGESINVTINSTTIDFANSLNGYVSPPLKMDSEMDSESIPSALENYTNAEGYEIFIFTLGEDLLLDDRVVGEHKISVVSIDTKGLEGSSKIVVVIENVNDTPVISSSKRSDGVTASNQNIFEVYEGGEDGIIRIKVRDADIQHGDVVGLNITGANLPTGVISIEKDKLSQSDTVNNQVEFVVRIASGLLQDTDIGEYPLDLLVYDEFDGAEDTRTITLKVNNVVEQPNIINVLAGTGVSASADGNSWILSEDVAGSLSIVVEDEDFGSMQNQESINITITSPTLPENFITVQQSEISSPDSSTDNRVTFRIEFTAPANELVGEHNVTFSFTDTDGNTALYKREFRIENVNDAPVISALTSLEGVVSINRDVFEVFEGGDNGTIKVIVNDADIQHGDVVGLNITGANLPAGIISIEKDKLSQSDTINNQVEFIVHIASGRLQDTDIGEYPLDLLVYDEFGGSATRDFIVIVEDTDDLTTISNFGWTGNLTSISRAPNNGGDLFTIYEGQSGQIQFTFSDEDLALAPLVISNITGDSIDSQIINATIRTKLSSPDERILTINIGNNSSGTHKIDDMHIGTYELSLNISSSAGEVAISYPFVLQIINVNDAPEIVEITHVGDISKGRMGEFDLYQLNEGSSGFLNITIADEDLVHSHENITVRWDNPYSLSDRLLSFNKQFFTSVDANDGTVNLVLWLGQGADFDDVHIDNYVIGLSIFDGNDVRINPIKSSILLEIVNVPERPFFPQLNHHITIFQQSGAVIVSAGTVIATIGEAYCSVADSTSGCEYPAPVLEASDPDPGDAAKLIYEIGPRGAEKFYVDGLQIKNRITLITGVRPNFIINAIDPSGMKVAPYTEAIVNVYIKSLNNFNQDFDGDGVYDPYDGAPVNPAAQTMGSGTRADPYLIHNIFQLQAIAGVDHLGNSLQASEFTGNSYLYGNGLAAQLNRHYRLANNITASITSTWNDGGGFIPIGTGVCNSDDTQCDATTAARLVDGTPVRFSGTFDGANFEISGLTINRQSSYLGLFGEAGDGSVIANLKLTSANIINSATRSNPSDAVKFSHGGVLVGQMLGGTIDNVHTTGRLVGLDYKYAGGVVGSLSPSANRTIPGIITNSMADVDITANGIEFGGLVGVLGLNSLIQASNAKGNVMSAVNDNNALLANYVGGLVGISRGYIFASYATGNVRGFFNVGGLAGNVLGGATTASFATGDVEGIIQVGGLVGEMLGGTHRYLYYSGQLIRSSYTSATPEFIGGIIGKLWARTNIYSVINMRSSNPYDTPKGGLVFGLIDLTVVQDIPNIHNAYSIYFPDNSLGYIAHKSYGTERGGPLSLLGDNAASIKAIPVVQLKYCSNDALFQGLFCAGLFNNNFWRDLRVSSLGSNYNVDWSIPSDNYPALKVQRVTGTGELDDASILPSPEEQRCYIEPEYTHPTYCPTTPR